MISSFTRLNIISARFILLGFVLIHCLSDAHGQSGIFAGDTLFYSKQTGEKTSSKGKYSINKTDSIFEKGSMALSVVGPIKIDNTNFVVPTGMPLHYDFSGTVTVDEATAPAPGNTVAAKITGNYDIFYSYSVPCSNCGTPVGGPWTCKVGPGTINGVQASCPRGHTYPGGPHMLYESTGSESENLFVCSIKACILGADAIIYNRKYLFKVSTYPETGGSLAYFTEKGVTSTINGKEVSITCSDTAVKSFKISCVFRYGGVSYTSWKTVVVKNDTPGSNPIDTGFVASDTKVCDCGNSAGSGTLAYNDTCSCRVKGNYDLSPVDPGFPTFTGQPFDNNKFKVLTSRGRETLVPVRFQLCGTSPTLSVAYDPEVSKCLSCGGAFFHVVSLSVECNGSTMYDAASEKIGDCGFSLFPVVINKRCECCNGYNGKISYYDPSCSECKPCGLSVGNEVIPKGFECCNGVNGVITFFDPGVSNCIYCWEMGNVVFPKGAPVIRCPN